MLPGASPRTSGAAGASNTFGGGPARPRGQVPAKPREQNARPAAQRQPPRRSELPDTSQVALAAASKDRRPDFPVFTSKGLRKNVRTSAPTKCVVHLRGRGLRQGA